MHHDSRISLLTPLPPLSMPATKPRPRAQPPRRTSRPRSTPLDPADLSARLSAVLTERDAADRTRRRSAAADARVRPPPTDPASAVVPSSVTVETLGLDSGLVRTRAEKAQSFAAPSGLEYPWDETPAPARGDESARDRSCPLLSEPIPSHATTARGDSTRRASNASVSRAAARPALDERQTPRSVSAEFLNYSPEAPRPRRRSSLRASHGFWEGLHEPTIFEAIASDSKPSDRRMSAGDALKAKLGRSAPERRVSFELPHYEVVNEHRVDWTQADEEAKMTRAGRLRRKADSILRLGRTPRTAHNGGNSSEGSLVDAQAGVYAVNGGPEKTSPKSPKSPRFLKIWPFKKQIAA